MKCNANKYDKINQSFDSKLQTKQLPKLFVSQQKTKVNKFLADEVKYDKKNKKYQKIQAKHTNLRFNRQGFQTIQHIFPTQSQSSKVKPQIPQRLFRNLSISSIPKQNKNQSPYNQQIKKNNLQINLSPLDLKKNSNIKSKTTQNKTLKTIVFQNLGSYQKRLILDKQSYVKDKKQKTPPKRVLIRCVPQFEGQFNIQQVTLNQKQIRMVSQQMKYRTNGQKRLFTAPEKKHLSIKLHNYNDLSKLEYLQQEKLNRDYQIQSENKKEFSSISIDQNESLLNFQEMQMNLSQDLPQHRQNQKINESEIINLKIQFCNPHESEPSQHNKEIQSKEQQGKYKQCNPQRKRAYYT